MIRIEKFPWTSLLLWYEKSGRHDLEWRDYKRGEEDLLYRVWLSEIFLQQTQVERVRGYFTRVVERFPTLQSLADTDYETFFPYYQGMGYYSRARNILKTAKMIQSEHLGIFPKEKEKLQKLPGVGEYTSRAILAFGSGKAYLAWDTNLEKVFARYYHGSRFEKLTEEEKEKIEEDFREFITNSQASLFSDEWGIGGGNDVKIKNRERASENSVATPEGFGTFPSKSTDSGLGKKEKVRSINNALMDFAATVDLKNPSSIDWENYPIRSGLWYDTRGSLEPQEVKKAESFPTPDATLVVILHQDHRVYYSEDSASYTPFILPPSLSRDTRKYVQDTFREKYGLELSVRPAHKKWLSEDGKPYIAVNAQIQTGTHDFREYSKREAKSVLDALG